MGHTAYRKFPQLYRLYGHAHALGGSSTSKRTQGKLAMSGGGRSSRTKINAWRACRYSFGKRRLCDEMECKSSRQCWRNCKLRSPCKAQRSANIADVSGRFVRASVKAGTATVPDRLRWLDCALMCSKWTCLKGATNWISSANSVAATQIFFRIKNQPITKNHIL